MLRGTESSTASFTKEGNRWLRWAFVEAVTSAVRVSPQLAVFYQRLKQRRGERRPSNGGCSVTKSMRSRLFQATEPKFPLPRALHHPHRGFRRTQKVAP